MALQRTLLIYGHIRECDMDGKVPLPSLYHVDHKAKETTLYFQNMGKDCEQFLPVEEKRWVALRDASIAALCGAGLGPRQSHHKKNWCLCRHGAGWKAYLIDVGNSSLKRSTVKQSKAMRDKYRLQPCP